MLKDLNKKRMSCLSPVEQQKSVAVLLGLLKEFFGNAKKTPWREGQCQRNMRPDPRSTSECY